MEMKIDEDNLIDFTVKIKSSKLQEEQSTVPLAIKFKGSEGASKFMVIYNLIIKSFTLII